MTKERSPNKLLRQNGSLLCDLGEKQTKEHSAFQASWELNSFKLRTFIHLQLSVNNSLAAEAGFVFYSKEGMTLGIWTELSPY